MIFDFDQTLVDSRSVETLRDAKAWDEVAARIPDLKLCPGVGDLLAYLGREGIRIGIVSNSPRAKYVDPLCRALGISAGAVIGFEDTPRPKPYRDGLILAVSKLWADSSTDPELWRKIYEANKKPVYCFYSAAGVDRGEVLVIGDNAHDIEAARRAGVGSVGALWDASEPDEVVLAEPDYLCASPADVIALVSHLRARPSGVGAGSPWAVAAKEKYHQLCREWHQFDGRFETRDWVTAGDRYFHLRVRHRGNWSRSLSNSHIEAFKMWPPRTGFEWAQREAVKRFARELAPFLPPGATYLCVPPSQARSDGAFNPRFDHLRAELRGLRPDLTYIEPIYLEASRAAAHATEGKEHRDPNQLMEHFRWNAAQWNRPARLYMIDDVLTLGTSFTAIQRFVRARIDYSCEFIGAAWALHC